MEKVLYEELTPTDFRKRLKEAPIAYLPLGTLEWHGEHMPLGADGIQSQMFFQLLAEKVGGIVLPKMFLGPDAVTKLPNGKELIGMDKCGPNFSKEQQYEDQQLAGSAYWISDEDFKNLLEIIIKQLKRAGFKIVVAHGHGPSVLLFDKYKEYWEKEYGIITLTGWTDEKELTLDNSLMVDHGGMNETSLVMDLRPELVHMEYLPEDMNVWPTGIGLCDPRIYAKREVGEKIINKQIPRLQKILQDKLDLLKSKEA